MGSCVEVPSLLVISTPCGNRIINPVLDFHHFLHLHFLFHPILPLVASLLPSRVSSWLMSSLGPELCQGAWYCSGPNQEDIRGPRWSLGTERGDWKHDRKVSELPTLIPTVLRLFSTLRLQCCTLAIWLDGLFLPKNLSKEREYVVVSRGPHKQRETDL